MTWHFCAVFGCNNSVKEQVACTEGCKQTTSRRSCSHLPKRPELMKLKFHPFPVEKELRRQWFLFLRRNDLKLENITRNHRICSAHFVLGLGYCKADRVPSVYNCSELEYLNAKARKRSAPKERQHFDSSLFKKVKVKKDSRVSQENEFVDTETDNHFNVNKQSTVQEIESVATCTETDNPVNLRTQSITVQEIESVATETDNPLNITPSTVHYIYQEHNYAGKLNTVGTQTLLTGEDIVKMEIKIQESTEKLANKEQLRKELFIEQVTKDDKSIRFYTGFPSLCLFLSFFNFIKPVAEGMNYWHGQKNTKDENEDRKTTGRKRKLSLYEEYVLTFVRLRLGLMSEHLANIFGVSISTVSKTFKTWINLLYYELKSLISWPSPSQIQIHRPKCFKNYPKTKVVIDCSEFQIEKPKMPTAQRVSWSEYKQRNTAKCLFGISPSGAFTFVSNLWSGSVSDREITQRSGLLDLLDPGDDVMADRGFKIRDLLLEKNCTLNIPPSTTGKPLSRKQVLKTRRIASARIHVERAIERIKNFKLLQGVIPLTLKPVIDQMVSVCAAICNIYPKLAN